MIGDKIGETKGKRLVRRVTSTDPPTAEVSFEDSGTMFGVATSGMGTYTSIIRPDGSIHGEGQGLIMTPDGEVVDLDRNGPGQIRKSRRRQLSRHALLPNRFRQPCAPQQHLRRLRVRSRCRRQHGFQSMGVEVARTPRSNRPELSSTRITGPEDLPEVPGFTQEARSSAPPPKLPTYAALVR